MTVGGVSVPALQDGVDPRMIAVTVVGATIAALYAAWALADLLPRWVSGGVIGLVVAITLLGQPSLAKQVGTLGYTLAVLLVLTPLLMLAPDLLTAEALGVGYGELLFMVSHAILLVIFAVPAGVLAYLAYRVEGGTGLLERLRNRLDTN